MTEPCDSGTSAPGKKSANFSAAERDIYSVLFHPSGQWILGGDLDGKIRQWEVATGNLVRTLEAAPLHTYDMSQHVHYGGVRGMAFTPDGKSLAAGGLTKGNQPARQCSAATRPAVQLGIGKIRAQLPVRIHQRANLEPALSPAGLPHRLPRRRQRRAGVLE